MRPPVQRIDIPSRRFSHVHLDLVGPLHSVRGYTHLFTVVDRSTRCVGQPPPRPGYLPQLPRRVDLLFQGPCHCHFGPRLPVHFIVLVCLLSLCGHSARDDDRLPPPVQQHGGEDASVVEGSFGGTPLFFVLSFRAALGPPQSQECASGAVWRFFRRTGVWHTAHTSLEGGH